MFEGWANAAGVPPSFPSLQKIAVLQVSSFLVGFLLAPAPPSWLIGFLATFVLSFLMRKIQASSPRTLH